MENPLKYFAICKTLGGANAGASSGRDSVDCDSGDSERSQRLERDRELWQGEARGLSSFLRLPGGIPSHDTFNRVFAALATEDLEDGFAAWVGSIARLTAGEVVAIDGKTLRGTRTTAGKALVHMVSAWASSNNLVLAQRKVDDKSNEITAIPKLLKALELSGAVVTIDAIGCQKSIADQIVAQQADYVLAVKENQPSLLDDIKDSFRMLAADSVADEIDCGHGRVERAPARCWPI